MIEKKIVIAAYNLLLQREPESEQAIEMHQKAPSIGALINAFMSSAEFKEKQPNLKGLRNEWVWTDIGNDALLRVNLADAHVSWNIIENNYEIAETKFVKSLVKPGMHVWDIGANLGYFTLLMSQLVGATGRIDAFEPLPFLHESLVKSISKNKLNDVVTAHKIALGNKNSEVELVYAPNSDNWGGAYLAFDGIIPAQHSTEKVDVRQISNVISPVRLDFIKIDVEGAEPLVLDSAGTFLEKFNPIVMSEIHPKQLKVVSKLSSGDYIKQMKGYGYSCFELLDNGELGDEVHEDQEERYLNAVFVN